MPTHIPQEILDTVGDFLHDDRPALLACSFCRELQPSARFHLFSEAPILLKTEEILVLIELLQSPLNTIAPYVRRILFNDLSRCVLLSGVACVERAVRCIPRLVSLLPSLRSLRITNTDFEHIPKDLVRSLLCYFKDFVEELDIHHSHFYLFSELVDLICSFPRLKRITLKRLAWTYQGRGIAALGRTAPDVQWHILEFKRAANLKDLAEWLAAHDSPPLLRSFYFEATSSGEVLHLGELLQRTAHSLWHLQVSFPAFSNSRQVSGILRQFINITECTSLRSLRYKHILLFPGDAVTSMIGPWIAKTLSQIRSDCLQDIAFELMLPNSSDETCLNEFDWSSISAVLRRRQFKYLQSILFSMSPGSAFDCTCAAKYILDQMPRFERALKLQII